MNESEKNHPRPLEPPTGSGGLAGGKKEGLLARLLKWLAKGPERDLSRREACSS
ncbi:MAG: hypothetical protein V1816_13675 [Pseudomonadota bacterium]